MINHTVSAGALNAAPRQNPYAGPPHKGTLANPIDQITVPAGSAFVGMTESHDWESKFVEFIVTMLSAQPTTTAAPSASEATIPSNTGVGMGSETLRFPNLATLGDIGEVLNRQRKDPYSPLNSNTTVHEGRKITIDSLINIRDGLHRPVPQAKSPREQRDNPFKPTRPEGRQSIVRQWVEELGPRFQGVLLASIRGCDTAAKYDDIKAIVRGYRSLILHSAAENPSSFMVLVDYHTPAPEIRNPWSSVRSLRELMDSVLRNCDHYPHHYLMHMVHAAEIVGYLHPDHEVRNTWLHFYTEFCRRMHVAVETQEQLQKRLGASEQEFAAVF